jgi:hypothetical protein
VANQKDKLSETQARALRFLRDEGPCRKKPAWFKSNTEEALRWRQFVKWVTTGKRWWLWFTDAGIDALEAWESEHNGVA